MNPWIVSTSKVQILKCIIVGLKSYLKLRFSFVSNRIRLIAAVSKKFIYFVFLQTFAPSPVSLRFPFRVLLKSLTSGSCMHVEYSKNTCDVSIPSLCMRNKGWGMHDKTQLRTHQANSWCENQATPHLLKKKNISNCLRGPTYTVKLNDDQGISRSFRVCL